MRFYFKELYCWYYKAWRQKLGKYSIFVSPYPANVVVFLFYSKIIASKFIRKFRFEVEQKAGGGAEQTCQKRRLKSFLKRWKRSVIINIRKFQFLIFAFSAVFHHTIEGCFSISTGWLVLHLRSKRKCVRGGGGREEDVGLSLHAKILPYLCIHRAFQIKRTKNFQSEECSF